MKLITIAIMMITTLNACQRDNDETQVVLTEQNLTDVSYGSDVKQKMDIYLPAGRSTDSTKIIVLIHGGSWNEGDKSDFASYLAAFKVRMPDYAIFNINYRLVTGSANQFPTQENDVKAAVEFIINKTDEYKVSKKLVLLGASAGGHLALLQAYKYNTPVKAKAVIDFFGPTDLTAMYNTASSPLIQFGLQAIIGATPSTNPTLYAQSSPITFVNAQSPPTLILHGGADPLVSPSQSVMLAAKLQASGVVHQYVLYANEGHSWGDPNLTDSFNKIEAFLDANVK